MTIFGITMRNAFKEVQIMSSIGLVIRKIDGVKFLKKAEKTNTFLHGKSNDGVTIDHSSCHFS